MFNKKNEARLKILENELEITTQDNLSIAEYFLKIKNLCSEISLLNSAEAIFEAQIRWIIICGLNSKYIFFATSIQGWPQQLSMELFKNLLSSQEVLANLLANVFVKEGKENVVIADTRNIKGKAWEMSHSWSSGGSRPLEEYSNNYSNKSLKCYRCGKVGHMKSYCRATESNITHTKTVMEEED